MMYQIALTITVEADNEEEAKEYLGDFMTAALVGEPGPVIDYSIEELLEAYES